MKNSAIRFALMMIVAAVPSRPPVALAKEQPKEPAKISEPAPPASETWYRGVVGAVDLKAGTLPIRAKVRGQTLHQRATASGDPFAVSSSAPVPDDEQNKAFKCGRDCQFIFPYKPKAGLGDFSVGSEVLVIYA